MIYPEGYIPLATITSECIVAATIKTAQDDPFDPTNLADNRAEWGRKIDFHGFHDGIYAAWHFCNEYDHQPYTMLTNGTVVRISNKLLNNWAVDKLGTYVDVAIGTLGSGCGFFDPQALMEAGDKVNEKVMRRAIGPFWGLPVLYIESEARGLVEDAQKVSSNLTNFDHQEIAEKIMGAFDADQSFTKAEARRQYCLHMKHAEFIATWEIAAKMRPELSKPGPRRGR